MGYQLVQISATDIVIYRPSYSVFSLVAKILIPRGTYYCTPENSPTASAIIHTCICIRTTEDRDLVTGLPGQYSHLSRSICKAIITQLY